MWTAEKRRVRELEKRNERLYYKFIYEYTKCLHPDVYTQANNMYRNIRELYPNQVKDITKTVEFMTATKPGHSIPRYYYHRKTINPHSGTSNAREINPHSGTSNAREMVLQIPLMTPSEIPLASIQVPPDPPAHVVTPSAPSPTAHVSQPPLLLEPHVYEELLKEIQNDPDLNRILSDFPGDFPPDAGTPDMDLNQILSDFPGDFPPDAGTPDMDLNQILSGFPGDFPPDAGTPDMDLNQILSGFPPDDTPVVWNDDDAMGLTPLEQELCLY